MQAAAAFKQNLSAVLTTCGKNGCMPKLEQACFAQTPSKEFVGPLECCHHAHHNRSA
jgi:hypothetical protein